MDHSEATATHAPERYLLGELTGAEAEAFEEHYFECALCADDLRIDLMILEGGRQLVREEAAAPPPVVQLDERRRRRHWPWLSGAAAAVMAFAIMTGTLLMRAPVPRMAFSTSTNGAATLSDDRADVPSVREGAKVKIPVLFEVSRYYVRVHGPEGKVVFEPPPLSREEVEKFDWFIPLEIQKSPPGHYRVVLSDAAGGTEKGVFAFKVVER